MEIRVLIVEDEPEAAKLMVRLLEQRDTTIVHDIVDTGTAFKEALARAEWDVVLADYTLPMFSAPEALRTLQETGLDIPFIVVSGRIGEDTAAEMMRAGATDFVSKVKLNRLLPAVTRALADAEMLRQRRAAEAVQLRIRENLRKIVRENVDGMIVLGEDGTVLFANPAVESLLGREQVEFLGQEFGTTASSHQTVEIQLVRSDRELVWVELRQTATDWEEKPAILLSLRDITERKDAEDKLHHLNRALTVLSRSNRTLVRTRDEDELLREVCRIVVKEGAYRFAWVGLLEDGPHRSLRPAAWTGHEDGYLEELGQRWVDLDDCSCPVGEAVRKAQALVIQDIAGSQSLERWRTAALRRSYRSLIALPLVAGENIIGALSIYAAVPNEFTPDEVRLLDELAEDLGFGIHVIRREAERRAITETLRETEQQVLQLQKLESVGRLAGGIAHDFNNVLQAIGGYTDFALAELQEGGQIHEDISAVRNLVNRAASLTQQLLAFSRRQTLHPEVIDLNEEIASSIKMLQRLIGEDIEISFEPADSLAPVLADPGQVYQVIMNLAVNARDAMPKGGSIAIKTTNRKLDEAYCNSHRGTAPGDYVEIIFQDTGAGMDEDTLARIFEPFFTTKGPKSGTGLGLSTVYGIVKQHGGNIWVSSQPGQGTSFEIFFPQTQSNQAGRKTEPSAKSTRGGGETILIVEDEAPVRSVLVRVLKNNGYDVFAAKNAAEAMAIAERCEDPIALMITDVVLPDTSGPELGAKVRNVLPNLPILFMSGYTDDTVFKQGLLTQETPFLQKPFSAKTLLNRVQQLISASS